MVDGETAGPTLNLAKPDTEAYRPRWAGSEWRSGHPTRSGEIFGRDLLEEAAELLHLLLGVVLGLLLVDHDTGLGHHRLVSEDRHGIGAEPHRQGDGVRGAGVDPRDRAVAVELDLGEER